jgi:hypothetical protein
MSFQLWIFGQLRIFGQLWVFDQRWFWPASDFNRRQHPASGREYPLTRPPALAADRDIAIGRIHSLLASFLRYEALALCRA